VKPAQTLITFQYRRHKDWLDYYRCVSLKKETSLRNSMS